MSKYYNLMMSTLSTPFVYFNKLENEESKAEKNFKIGVDFLNKNDVNGAISNFYAAYKDDDSSYESLNNTAALFNAFGKINDSVKLFEKGINKHPKNAQIRYNFGTLLFMNNALVDSKNQLEQAYSIDNKSIAIVNNYALACYSLKEFEKAEELLEETIKLDNKFELGYHNLAHLYMTKNEFKKAEEFFKNALSINDKNVVTMNDLGCCYCHLNDFAGAVEMFKKATSINPDYKNPYFNLGYVLLKENIAFSI